MIRKWFGITTLVLTASTLLSLSSCARSQKLVGLTVSPATATFGGVGAQIQFRAVGTYIHPPENKDVTQQATWSIDSQNLVTINSPGNVTAISDCGTGNVSASIQEGGNFVTGSAFVSAAGVGTAACTSAALTAVVAGTGTVTSSPSGITCPGTCSAAFPLDSSVTLGGAPTAPATTVTWSWGVGTAGCVSETATTCTLALNTNETITATFQ
jgi:hypothetical protein